MDNELLNLIKADLTADEGDRLKVYDDATGRPLKPGDTLIGHPTIGIGLCLDTDGLTQEEVIFILENRIKGFYMALQSAYSWFDELTNNRKRAIVNIVFQLGMEKFTFFKQTIASIAAGNWQDAHDCLLNSVYAHQSPARAEREAELLLNG